MPGNVIRRLQSAGPELVVMGLIAVVCGLALAVLLSVTLGVRSSGPPAVLKTVTTPTLNLGKLRQTSVGPPRAHKARRHKRARAAKKRNSASRGTAAPAVAELQTPTSGAEQGYTQGYQPTQQVGSPTNTLQVPVKKPAPTRKPSGSGGGSFDDSG